MKEKILWIIAVLLSWVTWFIHFNYYSKDFSNSEKRIEWFVDAWAMLTIMGICVFPLTLIVACFVPNKLTYPVRFNRILPFVVIFLEIITIYGLGSLAYGLKHGYRL